MGDRDEWFLQLQQIAGEFDEEVTNPLEWMDGFFSGLSPEQAFFEHFPEYAA